MRLVILGEDVDAARRVYMPYSVPGSSIVPERLDPAEFSVKSQNLEQIDWGNACDCGQRATTMAVEAVEARRANEDRLCIVRCRWCSHRYVARYD